MIRFSAALVAVAIGVLIGGIATSKLVLVYLAIAASAVALLALAIGVLLKREELFGVGQGLAPAQAGASPVPLARAGESRDQVPNGLVPPPLSQGAAVGPGAAFAERTAAASAQPGMSWAASAPPDAWPSPSAPTAAVLAMWQAPPVPAEAAVSGLGEPAVREPAPTDDPQGGVTAPNAWGTSAPSVFSPHSADAPAASPGAGAEPGLPNWFNPAGRPADAVPADKEEPEAAAPGADEDWPTRYSWLDEEPDEPAAGAESGGDKPAGPVAATVSEPAIPDVVAPAATEAIETAESADATEVPGEQETEPSASEPPGTGPGDQPSAVGLVTVVRGVPRFHQEDCVLIRFMPEGDTQQLPAAEAREAGCTPCVACQPAG